MTDNEKLDNFIERHRMYEDWEPETQKRKRSRANGEGSIRKRSNGTYEGRITIGWNEGKQIVKSVYAKTRKECNDKMQRLIKDVQEHNITLPDSIPTLNEWLMVWLNEYRANISEGTRRRYLLYFEKIPKEILNKKIVEVKPLELQQYINSFSAYGPANRAIGALNAAMQDALGNGLIDKNPAISLRNNNERSAKRYEDNKKSFTQSEEQAFTEAIKNNPYKLIYEISLLAGLRRGEATALKWENIDLNNRCIYIKEAAKREGTGYTVGSTKTTNSVRTVPMSPTLFDILNASENKTGLLCPNSHGTMLNADILTMDFAAIMKALGQKHTFHHLRHTFATRCIVDKGINPKVVQAWLGHATVDMTMNTYTHATEDLIDKEIQKL